MTKIKKCQCGSHKFTVRATGTFKGEINLDGRLIIDQPEWDQVYTFNCTKCGKEYASDQVWGIEVYMRDDLTKHAEDRQDTRHIPSSVIEYAVQNCFVREVGKEGERKQIYHMYDSDIDLAHPSMRCNLGNYKNLKVIRDKQTHKIITVYIDTMHRKGDA